MRELAQSQQIREVMEEDKKIFKSAIQFQAAIDCLRAKDIQS